MALDIKLRVAQDRECVSPTSRDVLLFVSLDTPAAGPKAQRVQFYKNADMVVVMDCSGSMNEPEDRTIPGSPTKLVSATRALWSLMERLRADDTLSIIAFDSRAECVLEPTSGRECQTRFADPNARAMLEAGFARFLGLTNVLDALKLARSKITGRAGAIPRVILLSDGIANLPKLGPEEAILSATQAYAEQVGKEGIPIYVLGYGQGQDLYPTFLQAMARVSGAEWEHVKGEPQTVFQKIFDDAQRAYAANTLLTVTFPQAVQTGNVFRYEPQIQHLGPAPVTAASRTVRIPAGQLEAGKRYTWIFETWAPITNAGVIKVADVELSYNLPDGTVGGDRKTVTVEMTDSLERAEARDGNYMIYYQEALLSKYDEALVVARKGNNRAEIERLLSMMVKQCNDAGLGDKGKMYQDQLADYQKTGDMTMTIMRVAGKTSVPQKSLAEQMRIGSEQVAPPPPPPQMPQPNPSKYGRRPR